MTRPIDPAPLDTLLAALAMPLAPVAAAAPAPHPITLIPDGEFRASDGRPFGLSGWRLDEDIAARLIDRVRGRKTKLVVNYEHAEARGHPLPAAGWIDPASLTYTPGVGLTAVVDWLPAARAMLAAGEYAYLSPVIRYDPATGAVLDLLLAGLTNTPALDGLPPLTAALRAALGQAIAQDASLADFRRDLAALGLTDPPTSTEFSMHFTDTEAAALRAALRLTADAAPAVVVDAAQQLAASAQDAAQLQEQVAALKAAPPATPDLGQWVPRAVHDEALATLRTLAADQGQSEIARLVADGLSSGRIVGPAHAAFLQEQGLDALRAYLAEAPVLAALTRTQTQEQPRGGPRAPTLSPEEQAVLTQMGLDREAYLSTRATLFPES